MKSFRIIDAVYLAAIAILSYLYFTNQNQENVVMEELTVQRINVVGENGNKYIVLSNPERQALPTIGGKLVDETQTTRDSPGLIFFNSIGDEIGGLIYDATDSSSHQLLTYDQHKNDQVMCLRRDEELVNGKWQKSYGLTFQERADNPTIDVLVKEYNKLAEIEDKDERNKAEKEFFMNPDHQAPTRMFIGRLPDGEYGLFLRDQQGRPRAELYMDTDGNPHFKVMDSLGKEIQKVED